MRKWGKGQAKVGAGYVAYTCFIALVVIEKLVINTSTVKSFGAGRVTVM
jgi:hypothetical protein